MLSHDALGTRYELITPLARLNAEAEYRDRYDRERQKAREKYGQEAADKPAGNWDLDVFDYLINELVGLNRYGELVHNRVRMLKDADMMPSKLARALIACGHEIQQGSSLLAVPMIAHRQMMKNLGISLGCTEYPQNKKIDG